MAFVRYPKDLFDDVLRGRFTGNQRNIVNTVIRYTYGHMNQTGGARISRRKIGEWTQLHDRTVRRELDKLMKQGVVIEVEPATGRQPARIAIQTDARRWGIHSPGAPPLRSAPGNPDKLREHQFRAHESGRARPDNADGSCGHGSAPPAGVDAQTSHGRGRPDSEEPEEGCLKKHDSGSLCEPPLSACGEEDQELSYEKGKQLVSEFLARHKSEAQRAMVKKAMGSERRVS